MTGRKWERCARCAAWWVRRNPSYLLSAACMAVGARLYLVTPSAYAGDVGLILLTLGALQFYELAVTALLLVLHRSRRAPEDEPSLLLVAALFWTGPLAATIEMTARRSDWGLGCALAVCVIAWLELGAARRVLQLRLSPAARFVASGCVLLLATAPPLLRVPLAADGSNELFMFTTWWLLGGLAVPVVAAIRWHARRVDTVDSAEMVVSADVRREVAFLAIVIGATTAHLVAMNHGFYTHARPFYAAPLVIAAAVGLVEIGHQFTVGRRFALFLAASLPALAVGTATDSFESTFPRQLLPTWLVEPLLTTSLLAGLAYWYAYARQRSTLWLHAGNALMALAAFVAYRRLWPAADATETMIHSLDAHASVAALLLYAATAYLFISAWVSQSRFELAAAIVLHQVALVALVWGQLRADVMISFLGAGWSTLLYIFLLMRRPRPAIVVWPLAYLTLVTWLHDFDAALHTEARVHAVSLCLAAAVLCLFERTRGYRVMAASVSLANLLFIGVRSVGSGPHAVAGIATAGAFVLLAAGAVLSWHKREIIPPGGTGPSELSDAVAGASEEPA